VTTAQLTKPHVSAVYDPHRVHDAIGGAIAPCLPLLRRTLKHPRLKHYDRLVALAIAVNLGWALYGATAANWWTSDGADLGAIAFMAQANLAAAVMFRQQYILNALAWLVTRPPTCWPLRVRWALGKYYHFGGLHVGAAVAGTLWYSALVSSMIRDAVAGVGEASHAHMILGITIATMFTVMVVSALPRLRAAHHDRFEITHRLCGWAAIVLVWINTMLVVDGDRGDRSFGSALLTAPAFWLVMLSALLAIWPWLLLRRIPISCERPSSHALILRPTQYGRHRLRHRPIRRRKDGGHPRGGGRPIRTRQQAPVGRGRRMAWAGTRGSR
jgi:hypothetical protein